MNTDTLSGPFKTLTFFGIVIMLAGCQKISERHIGSANSQHLESEKENHKIVHMSVPNGYLAHLNDTEIIELIKQTITQAPEIRVADWLALAANDELTAVKGNRKFQGNLTSHAGRIYNGQDWSNSLELNATISWEVDLYGKLSSQTMEKAALAELARSDAEGLRLSIASRIAKEWIDWGYSHEVHILLKELAYSTLAEREAWNIRWKEFGNSNALAEMAELDNEVAIINKRIHEILLQKYESNKAIIKISGNKKINHLTAPKKMPILPEQWTQWPTGIIRNRPDIQKALWEIKRVSAQVDQAWAERWPTIKLSASGGYAGEKINELFKPEQAIANLVAGIAAPVFDGGRRKSLSNARISELKAATAKFEKVAVDAWHESMNSIEFIERALALLNKEKEYYNTALSNYVSIESDHKSGLIDAETLWTSKQVLIERSIAKITAKKQAWEAWLSFYLTQAIPPLPERLPKAFRKIDSDGAFIIEYLK